jgi:hypothetical protein
VIGGGGLQPFDLDLDRQQIGIGLGEDARRTSPRLARRSCTRGSTPGKASAETVTTVENYAEGEDGGRDDLGRTDEQRRAGLQANRRANSPTKEVPMDHAPL